ncbi:MAG: preprotein translocase subunit SecA [Gammaproteobacteria bacterium]|nr:preprotein translocase subunit SecA [Gammaproteobacteria bacterium]MCH9744747.1 preprotein translocase subunit SecA [Gammaproteobacteria bacterium]
MVSKALKKIFGTRNERIIKSYSKSVAKINALEPEIEALSDEALKAKTTEFKQRLDQGAKLDDLLVEAFAVVRETSKRTLGMRHFDVQLIGGMVLHHGKISEMRTGEGKTLSSTLPVYLNALSGQGVHLVTINDYLASRDAEWMRPIYDFLGMTVGINLSNMEPAEKQAAYNADITYGTNNEFGFDYLRDNMVFRAEDRVQRPLNFAVVDEVDSILIDEARTPLIISGQAEESSELYDKIHKLIPSLTLQKQGEDQKDEEVPEEDRGDYTVDEKSKQAHLTEQGHQKVESLMIEQGLLQEGDSLYDINNISLMHYLMASLRANALYQRDVDYVVQNGEVMIVDEHTGRIMEGRRWSDGLHQAMEAKEGIEVQLENQTLATITFQNYFRLYNKLSGMTGTADTEAFELQNIYGLEVIVIPTNKPMVRDDRADQIFLTQKEKVKAILQDIKQCQEKQQPVLVGTASVESSELFSQLLKKEKIKHEVLNAKQHEREAKIIAQAGLPGAVTIATNMAGRGTDIVLGGSLEAELEELGDASEDKIAAVKQDWQKRHTQVLESGGLHVLGTERHESRRIDNQLRGRAGRQGDPGSSQFYLSMEDNLLRIFAAERMANLMRRLGIKEGDVIQHKWITNAIEKAQRRVENYNFDVRKNLLEYDDVTNDQRKVIYSQRRELLHAENISGSIETVLHDAISELITEYIPPQSLEEQWDVIGLQKRLKQDFALQVDIDKWLQEDETLHEESLGERIQQAAKEHYDTKMKEIEPEALHDAQKGLMLQLLDQHWKEHLASMDHLRQGIHLRGYAQKNPAQEYKRESFDMFKRMLDSVRFEFVSTLCCLEIGPAPVMDQSHISPAMHFQHDGFKGMPSDLNESPDQVAMEQEHATSEELQQPFVRETPKVGRNELCPCGSGKKYKQCHGKIS